MSDSFSEQSVSVNVIRAGFVARVEGLDLTRPLDPESADQVSRAWRAHPVLVFPGQSLGPSELRQFGAQFGVLEPEPPMNRHYLFEGEECVSYVGNVHPDGTPYPVGNQRAASWHTDQSYMAEPVSAGVLHALRVPGSGGGTEFCDMHAAYDALHGDLKTRVDGLTGLHRYNQGIGNAVARPLDEAKHGKWPTVRHPVVRTHPESGRRSLYVNRIHTYGIEGMDESEGRELLDRLIAHACNAERTYYHAWQVGDVVLWDQRCLMHKNAADYPVEEARLLIRVKITGDAPV